MAPGVVEPKLEIAGPLQEAGESKLKTNGSDVRSFLQESHSCTDSHVQSLTSQDQAKKTEESGTQQAATQRVKIESGNAVEAMKELLAAKRAREPSSKSSSMKAKRRDTKRPTPLLFHPYAPTDPNRQGASFRPERTEEEEDTVGPEDVDNVPGEYPRYADRTYYPDGSRCS